ncbi:hypothetical protein ACJX0J_030173, partial [Zea mays]
MFSTAASLSFIGDPNPPHIYSNFTPFDEPMHLCDHDLYLHQLYVLFIRGVYLRSVSAIPAETGVIEHQVEPLICASQEMQIKVLRY